MSCSFQEYENCGNYRFLVGAIVPNSEWDLQILTVPGVESLIPNSFPACWGRSWDKAKGLITLGSNVLEHYLPNEFRRRLDAYLSAKSDLLQRDTVDEFGASQIGIAIPSFPHDLPEVMRQAPLRLLLFVASSRKANRRLRGSFATVSFPIIHFIQALDGTSSLIVKDILIKILQTPN